MQACRRRETDTKQLRDDKAVPWRAACMPLAAARAARDSHHLNFEARTACKWNGDEPALAVTLQRCPHMSALHCQALPRPRVR